MTTPDFEIDTGIRARRLVLRVPPDSQTASEDSDVTGEERCTGVPARRESGEPYAQLFIEKRIVGTIDRETRES